MKKSNLKAYVKRFDVVFEKTLCVIDEIEENASSISESLMLCASHKPEKGCYRRVNVSVIMIKNTPIPLCISFARMGDAAARFNYVYNEIEMFGINPRLEAIKNFSKNFRWVQNMAHEIVHAFQHHSWGPNLKKLNKSELKGVEIEATVFSVPIALAIFMVRGNPFSRADYEEFIQRLIFVQTGYPYFRMVEVRNAILKNKEFIWAYANDLRLRYTDYDPSTNKYVGVA